MSKLEIISKQKVLGKKFKVYGDFENPLFLAKDVAEWIGHSQSDVMIKNVDEDEKVLKNVQTLGGNQTAWFLTEDGLYEVLMQSRKPIAKDFKKQVKTILKQIRKKGYYLEKEKTTVRWNELRNDGKESQKEFSLAVKEYVNYCTANGSRNGSRYYGNFNSMINSAVGCKHRDTADSIQLAQLSVYDLILSQIIRNNITQGTEYHEIFKLCKDFVLNNRTSLEMGRRTK